MADHARERLGVLRDTGTGWCNALYYRGERAYWCRLTKGHPEDVDHTCPGEARESTPGWANKPW